MWFICFAFMVVFFPSLPSLNAFKHSNHWYMETDRTRHMQMQNAKQRLCLQPSQAIQLNNWDALFALTLSLGTIDECLLSCMLFICRRCVIEYVTYTLFINHKYKLALFQWGLIAYLAREHDLCVSHYYFLLRSIALHKTRTYTVEHMKFTIIFFLVKLNDFHVANSAFFVLLARSRCLFFSFFLMSRFTRAQRFR